LHQNPPVYADVALTGVISPEYGQAVSPFGAADSITLTGLYLNIGRDTTEKPIFSAFFSPVTLGFVY
jgi:hypothetical protein